MKRALIFKNKILHGQQPIKRVSIRTYKDKRFIKSNSFTRPKIVLRFSKPKLSLHLPLPRIAPLISRSISFIIKQYAKIQNNRTYRSIPPISPRGRLVRVRCVAAVIAMFAIGIVARLCVLQGSENAKWLKLALSQYSTSVQVEGARGDIIDAQGRVLGTSVSAISIGAHPRDIKDKEEVVIQLAKLGVDDAALRAELAVDKPFVWLARSLPTSAQTAVEELNNSHVNTYPSFRRYYPQGSLAAPVLGRIGRSGRGQAGIELAFDRQLRAEHQFQSLGRDARGRYMSSPTRGEFVRVSKRNEGNSIQLTIDSFVQNIVEEEVRLGRETAKAKEVFAVVMDADNGGILAMAQTQGFDPNALTGVAPDELKNVIVETSFEPGSTMKPLVAAFGMAEGVVRLGEIMNCEESGRYKVGRHTVRDVHPLGVAPFEQVIIQSSNICMTQIGQRLGRTRLYETLSKLGFGKRSGIEVSGEGEGILRHHRAWRDIDIATHSFGQGVAVTAIQMVRAYAVLANGGYLVQPTLLAAKAQVPKREKILDSKVAEEMSAILHRVVVDEDGTGKRAAVPGLMVYGKTGTAQKAKTDGRGYMSDAVLSSFIGFVNGMEVGLDRSLVMLVVVDEPGVKPRWGGVLAAPIFRQSMERIIPYLLTIETDTRTAGLRTRLRKSDIS